MSRQTHFDWFKSRSPRPAAARRRGRTTQPEWQQRSRRLRCEPLEDRRLLAIFVDTYDDVVDPADGVTSLREAVAAATSGEEIILSSVGTGGTEFITLDPSLGEIVIDKDLIIQGNQKGVRATPAGGHRVFRATSGVSFVSFSNLTIAGGDVDGDGGGVYAENDVFLFDVDFSDNMASGRGGGLYAGGFVDIVDGRFLLNNASDGGGLYSSSTQIRGASFFGNDAAGDGGGLYANVVDVQDARFTNNEAGQHGGGLFFDGLFTETSSTITDSTFEGNTAAGNGGAIYASLVETQLEIDRSRVVSNNAQSGGGVYLQTSSFGGLGTVAYVRNTEISGNEANGLGGGIYSANFEEIIPVDPDDLSLGFISTRGTTQVSQSTISNNTALNGGGMYIFNPHNDPFGQVFFSSPEPYDIAYSTFAGNSVTGPQGNDYGAGIYVEGGNSVEAISTLVYSNLILPLLGFYDVAGFDFFSSEGLYGSLSPSLDGFQSSAIVGVDPLLEPLADNGGPTHTHAVQLGSPAINAGPVSATQAIDQRGSGFARKVGGRLDIGAFELQLPDIEVTTAADAVDSSDGVLSLREAISVAKTRTDSPTITFSPALENQTITLLLGELLIDDDLNIEGPGANLLTLVARDPTPELNNSDGSRVFRIVGPAGLEPVVNISGLTLTNGDAGNFGGAIYADSGTLTIEDAILSDNFAPLFGGAIHMASGEVIVRRSRFLENMTNGGGGGLSSQGSATVEDSDFRENIAINGGGIDIGDGSNPPQHSLTVRRSVFDGNQATINAGGGIYTHSTTTDVLVEDSIFNDNFAGAGGGIYLNLPGVAANAHVIASTFSNNAASGGGGIYITGSTGGNVSINDSTIENNSANNQSGGGIQSEVSFALSNSTVSGNGASVDGGGLVAAGNSTVAIISHSTITQNVAGAGSNVGSGGGIFMFDGATLQLDHTIVAENNDNGNNIAPDLNLNLSEPNTVAHSLIGDNTGSGLIATPSDEPDTNGNLIGPAFFQSSLTVIVDMAAMGDFEAGDDYYNFEYAIDDGPFLPLFTSVVDENATQDYTLENGTEVTLPDPVLVDGVFLDNRFRTHSAQIPNAGGEVYIRFIGHSNGGSVAFAWRNLVLRNEKGSVIGRAASSDPANDLFASFVQIDPDYSILDDMFGLRNRIDGIPAAIADDSNGAHPSDVQGIIGALDNGNFFGVVDTVNSVGNDENVALWQFAYDGVPIDPRLGTLTDNGGPTRTHNPMVDSPALDGGEASYAGPLTNDGRGGPFVRVVDGNGDSTARVDIGAVERQTIDTLPFALIVDSPFDEYDGDFSAGNLSLREATSFANLVDGADTIDFDSSLVGSTINLMRGELGVTEGLTINGLGADRLTIDASWNDPTPDEINGDGSRVFDFSGASVSDSFSLSKLSITGGDTLTSGGGILTFSPLTLSEISIHDNHSGSGGGVYASEPLTISQSTVSQNSANGSGGGVVFIGSADPLVIEGSTFANNTAGDEGGGLWSDTDLNGVGVGLIRSSTFSGNSAANEGGGIRNWIGALTIEHSTITANSASPGQGSGISSYGLNDTSTQLYSTIVSGNFGSDVDANPVNVNSFVSAGYNLIGTGNASANFTLPGDQPGVTSPKLGPLGDNGGPTFTHALLPGSPAIDAGELSPSSPPATDQRGAVRIVDGDQNTLVQIDIGAYELQQPVELVRGDYNQDGMVDGVDYAVWRDTLGNSVSAFTGADGDGSGIIDQQDYLVWRINYGATTTTRPDLSQSLIGYWPFDNGGSDQSPTGANLSLVGSATTPPGGIVGNALSLNNPQPSTEANVNQWAQRSGDDNVYDLINTDFTIQTWFLLSSAGGAEQVLIDKLEGGGAGSGWTFSVKQHEGTLQFYTASGGFVSVDQPTISTGVWHQAIVRSDANGTDLWFDGVQIAENLALPQIETHTEQLRIGRRNPSANQGLGLSGRIDEVALWDRSLETRDIQYLWNNGFGRPVLETGAGASLASTVAEVTTEDQAISPATNVMPVDLWQSLAFNQPKVSSTVRSKTASLAAPASINSDALLLHLLESRAPSPCERPYTEFSEEKRSPNESITEQHWEEIDYALAGW